MGKPIACTTPAAFSATPTKGSAAKNVGSLVNTTDDGFKTIGLQAMRIDNGGEPVDCVIKRIVIRTETAVSLIGNIGDAAKRIGDAAMRILDEAKRMLNEAKRILKIGHPGKSQILNYLARLKANPLRR